MTVHCITPLPYYIVYYKNIPRHNSYFLFHLREAALNCPSTTDSEPDQLAPGSKYESTKYQRVPSMKKHVLEKQRRYPFM